METVLAQAPASQQQPAFSVGAIRKTEAEDAEAAPFPDIKSGPPNLIWSDYFGRNRPTEAALRKEILNLHNQGEHEHVIHAIQSALLNGQSQPWMYEVLALSMEIAGRPKEEVQRVLLSLTDFGSANFESMMYSAAYLLRFGRDEMALRLYRQASRQAPERAEPYILGLKLARQHPQDDAVQWAATGVLEYGWTKNYEQLHQEAEDAIVEETRRLRKTNDQQALATFQSAIQQARRRDLRVTLTWNGPADLDLIVEEPGGTVCSFDSADTPGGGIHLHDGFGPVASNCREEYVCPQGVSGTYRLRIKHAWGDVVGRRAQLTITEHEGSPNEKTIRQTVTIGDSDSVVPMTLKNGRRTHPRTVTTSQIDPVSAARPQQRFSARSSVITAGHSEADLDRFNQSRRNSAVVAGTNQAAPTVGAVGFQSVISTVNDGTFLQVNPVVSADRRYVRVAVNPQFTTLTDVFTFSFLTTTSGGQQVP
ncbi:MAG: hypothetical protein R3B91_05785 [Planctomycetaceae bacterium]